MSEELKHLVDGNCAGCGAGTDSLLLAEDYAHYTSVERDVDGKFQRSGNTSEEALDNDDSVRLFCTVCGQYHHLPEELT